MAGPQPTREWGTTMRKISAVLTVGLALGMLALTGGTASAAPAAVHPLVTCTGRTCDGLDPSTTTCQNDAITPTNPAKVNPLLVDGVRLELRYSPSCKANWARMTPGQFGWHFQVLNANGGHHDSTGLGQSATWTAMVDGTVLAWACFDGPGQCTSQF